MAHQFRHFLAGICIPDANGPVTRCGHNSLSIWPDRDAIHRSRMPCQCRPALAGLQVPNLYRLVI